MQIPLDQLRVILILSLAYVNSLLVVGKQVVILGAFCNFLNPKLLCILAVIGLLDDHRAVCIIVSMDCYHLVG